MAGSNVIEVHTARNTAIADANPRVLTSGIPATTSDSRAMTTVPPAKTTALPDEATARAIDSRSSTPSPSCSRCFVIRNNA